MYAREKTRYMNEQFIEIFDLDLVTLPRDLPPWFIEQMQMLVCRSPWQPLSELLPHGRLPTPPGGGRAHRVKVRPG
jgi:hypothetical protein